MAESVFGGMRCLQSGLDFRQYLSLPCEGFGLIAGY